MPVTIEGRHAPCRLRLHVHDTGLHHAFPVRARVESSDHHVARRADAERTTRCTAPESSGRHRRRPPVESPRNRDPDGARQRAATPAGRPCRSSLSCGPGPRPAGCRAAHGGARAPVGPGAPDGVASRGARPAATRSPCRFHDGGPDLERDASACATLTCIKRRCCCRIYGCRHGIGQQSMTMKSGGELKRGVEPALGRDRSMPCTMGAIECALRESSGGVDRRSASPGQGEGT